MNSYYTFFIDESPFDDEEMPSGEIPDTEKVDPKYGKEFPCGHSYAEHVWYDKPLKPVILGAG